MNTFRLPKFVSETIIANSISYFVDHWHNNVVIDALDDEVYDWLSWRFTNPYRYQEMIYNDYHSHNAAVT